MTEKTILQKAPILKTPRLTMHAFCEDDAESAIKLLCNDEIAKTFMLPAFKSREQAAKMFDALKRMSNAKEHFVYGVYLDETLIGFLNDVARNDTAIELGYVIDPSMKNQGFATEMLAASIQELFRMGYSEIRAGFFEENPASGRVMEKCGMQITSYTHDIQYRGSIHHCIYYAISR